jgi:DICT domain-containing protein
MFECIYAIFQVTEEQMDTFIEMFIKRLPEYMQRALTRVPMAA